MPFPPWTVPARGCLQQDNTLNTQHTKKGEKKEEKKGGILHSVVAVVSSSSLVVVEVVVVVVDIFVFLIKKLLT